VSRYDLIVFLHVACAIIWLGAGLLMVLLELKASRSGDPAELGRIGADNEWLAPRLFIPASLATLVFGILAVADGPWTFSTLWVDLGLAGFALTFLTGIGVIKPESERLKAAVERHGPQSPEVARHAHRLALVSRLDAVVLFAVVAVMVSKPSADDPWTLVGLGVGMVAAWLLILWASRAESGAPAEATRA
jgi:uncharacterized membrane protein